MDLTNVVVRQYFLYLISKIRANFGMRLLYAEVRLHLIKSHLSFNFCRTGMSVFCCNYTC